MASATDLGIVEVFCIQNQVAGGIGPVRKKRHRASHTHDPGACRLQPLLVSLMVIALRFVGHHQRTVSRQVRKHNRCSTTCAHVCLERLISISPGRLQRMTAVLLLSGQVYFVMPTDGYMQSLKGVLTATQLPDSAPLMNRTCSLSNCLASPATKYVGLPGRPANIGQRLKF